MATLGFALQSATRIGLAMRARNRKMQPQGPTMHASVRMIPVFLAGILIGATGVKKIFAQPQPPPAYFISETTIKDPDLYKKFLAVEAPNADFGGHQLVRGGRVVAIEGEPAPPPRV